MKHIFNIHSAITYIAALSIISKENFDINDCIIICDYDSGFDNNIPIRYLSGVKELQKPFKYAQRLIDFISKECEGEEYYLYTAIVNYKARILLTANQCKGLRFFEEGDINYMNSFSVEDIVAEYPMNESWRVNGFKAFLREIRQALGDAYNGISRKMRMLPFNYVEYATDKDVICYCFSEKSFPLAVTRKYISFINPLTQKLKRTLDLDNHYLWISGKEIKPYNSEKVMSLYKNRLSKFLSDENVTNIMIKFHPGESEFAKNKTKEMFNDFGVKYTIIGDDKIMEIELLASKNVTMLGGLSSLLMYNTMYGHRSISLAKDFETFMAIGKDFYRMRENVVFL